MRTFFMLYVVPCNALMSLRSINRGPQKILLYLRGEKALTSKRVSVIAGDNAISKAQCAPYIPEELPCVLKLCKKMHFRYKKSPHKSMRTF